MKILKSDLVFGKKAANKIDKINQNSLEGALAALETFYYSFNNKDIKTFNQIWVQDDLVQLNNPVGGILRGIHDISNLYLNIFQGRADVWVEFYDFVTYEFDNCIVFAGNERGEFIKDNQKIDLHIRTTRFFGYANGKWGQLHHHGSIDQPELLDIYQKAVKS